MGHYIDDHGHYYEGCRQGQDMEVTRRPSLNHDWIGGAWVENPARAQAAAVAAFKAEAARRILTRWPDYQQRNMTARALELTRKRVAGSVLTQAEIDEETAFQAAWDWIKLVRGAENAATAAAMAAGTVAAVAAIIPAWPGAL